MTKSNSTDGLPTTPCAPHRADGRCRFYFVKTDVAHLAEHTSRYVEAGLSGAANTAKAYAGDLKRFGAWCAEYELNPLPAAVATLAGFVAHLAETGRKVSTIQRHCAAVSKAHALRGVDSPTDDKKFKVLLGGISRLKGVWQKQAPVFTLANFKRTVKSIAGRIAGPGDFAAMLYRGLPPLRAGGAERVGLGVLGGRVDCQFGQA